MIPVKQAKVAVIGDKDLVTALRLAGVSRYYIVDSGHDVREHVREALTRFLAEPDMGIVVLPEDLAQYVKDVVNEARRRKGVMPVIVVVPTKFGTKYPDPRAYYRGLIRESIGFELEI